MSQKTAARVKPAEAETAFGPGDAEAGGLLTIDLSALAANYRDLAARAKPAECAAVVKADAYGIGLEPAAAALVAAGCKTFFVALLDEALKLRTVAPDAVIYVLNGLNPGTAERLPRHRCAAGARLHGRDRRMGCGSPRRQGAAPGRDSYRHRHVAPRAIRRRGGRARGKTEKPRFQAVPGDEPPRPRRRGGPADDFAADRRLQGARREISRHYGLARQFRRTLGASRRTLRSRAPRHLALWRPCADRRATTRCSPWCAST